MTGESPTLTATDCARRIAQTLVAELAPEELAFFSAAADQYFRTGRLPDRKRRGSTENAWGDVNELITLITPAALAMSASVTHEFFKATGKGLVDRSKATGRWLGGKVRRRTNGPVNTESNSGNTAIAAIPALSPERLHQVKTAAEAAARTMGLPENDVRLLVDSLIGRLVLDGAPAQTQPDTAGESRP